MKLISIMAKELKKRQSKNSSYSLRAFARDLEVSHGHLVHLLSGKKSFSHKVVKKIIINLGISDGESALILKDIEAQEEIKKSVKNLLKGNLSADLGSIPIGADEYLPISHWSYDAIFHLIDNGKLEDEIENLSRRLKLSRDYTLQCINDLIDAGILENKEGKLKKVCASYFMKGGVTEMKMNKLVESFSKSQKELFQIGMNQFELKETSNNQYTTQAYRVSSEDVETIRESILQFSDSIEQVLRLSQKQSSDENSHIYFFNTQFFPVT